MTGKKEKLFELNEKVFKRISGDEFDDVTFNGDKPALVLFGAERCSVCKEIQPVLEEIVPQHGDNINSYFVDIDIDDDLMKRFRLRGIPTILIFSEGEVKGRTAGMRTEDELVDFIENTLVK